MTPVLRRRAFGAVAETYIPYLGDLPVIAISDELKTARDEVLDARRKGVALAVMPMLDDARTKFSVAAARDVCQQVSDYDHRRFYMELIHSGDLDLGGRRLGDFADDREALAPLADIVRLATTVVVRSFTELERIERVVWRVVANVAYWHPPRTLPEFQRTPGNGIVIWAPDSSGDDLAIAAFALSQYHASVTIVAAGAPPFATNAAHVHPDDPSVPSLLAAASCVLDATISDPGWTVAFAQRGIPVAAPVTSGAREIVAGIGIYDPWSFFSIARAVAATLGRGAGRIRYPERQSPQIESILSLSQPEAPESPPLVSIVIPSFNRPRLLEQTLKQLLLQTYANIEIVVVNDGGTSLSHLGGLDDRIRVFDRTENVGAHEAINVGVREAKGEYVQPCADDDVFYPNHVALLVDALERTGSTVAHGNTVVCVQGVDGAGNDTLMLITDRFIDAIDLTETYAYHRIAQFMVRRSALLELGGYAQELFMADIDLIIRLAERYDFVHVPVVTGEHWMRGTGQLSTDPKVDHRAELLKLFESHPAPGRPYVAALRKRVLDILGDQNSSSSGVIGASSSSSSSVKSSSSSSSV